MAKLSLTFNFSKGDKTIVVDSVDSEGFICKFFFKADDHSSIVQLLTDEIRSFLRKEKSHA